jgi:hypothetical protein
MGHWWALVHCGQKSGALWNFFSLLGTKKLSQTPIDPTYHSYTYNQYSCSVNHWTNWAQFYIIAVFLTYSSSDQRYATYQMLLFAPYSSATLVSGSKNVQIILGLVLNCVPWKSKDLHWAVEIFALQLVTGLQHETTVVSGWSISIARSA